MDINLCIGIKKRVNKCISEKDTASIASSGDLKVFSTPGMIAMMENASMNLVKDYLETEYTTVGIEVHIKHLSATPIGMEVWAEAKLIEVDNRRLVFQVKAWDEKDLIGEGIYERFIVQKDRFLARTQEK